MRAANGPGLRTVVVRPRLIWGNDDSSVLTQLEHAVNAGRFMWIGDGRYPTSSCHVDNLCEGLLLAAEKGRGGVVYFVTDGAPVELRGFVTAEKFRDTVEKMPKSPYREYLMGRLKG